MRVAVDGPMIEPRRRNDPAVVGNFRILGRLGAGGFGTVYVAARRDRPDELVALKVLLAGLAGDPDFRSRFSKEIRAIGQVSSDYVPGLTDHGADADPMWLATELVRGPSLFQVVRRCGPLPVETVWRLALGIAMGLSDIHRVELHRDLKPGNVLLVPDGPRIIDFGLAHLPDTDHQTMTGQAICSPEYASPEQRRSLRAARAPADVFTLGGTLLFAATGHPPYGTGRDPMTAPPNLADLPGPLYDVVAQCLCDSSEARPSLPVLIAEFKRQAGITADRVGLGFSSVLTAGMQAVMDAWHRDLEEVLSLTDPGGAGTTLLTRSQGQPDPFGHNQDGGRITVREPAPARSAAGEGHGAGEGRGAELRWKRRLGDWVRAPVTANRELALAASLSGEVVCFAARNGTVLGKANLGVPVRSAVLPPGFTSTGLAYAGGADGVLYAINLASGQYSALLHANAAIDAPLVAIGDRIYALSEDGCVYGVDARASGETALLCELGVPVAGTLTIADGVIVAASAEGVIYAIDPADGAIRWRRPTGGLVFGAPAAVAGWLYLGGTDGRLWFGRVDGRQHATLDIGVPVHAGVVHDRGRLYVGGADGKVRAFAVSGPAEVAPALLWTSPGIGGEVSGIAAHGGAVVAAAGRTLTALDADSGQRRAWFTAETLITANPVIAKDLTYIAALDGAVSCLALAELPDTGRFEYLFKRYKFTT
jgi:outer membrane protein assembly factor BamB